MNLRILLLSSLLLLACQEQLVIESASIPVPSDPFEPTIHEPVESHTNQSTKSINVSLLEGDSLKIENVTLQLIRADNEAFFQYGIDQFTLSPNQEKQLGDFTLRLQKINLDAKTEPRLSFADISSRIFGEAGYREMIAVGETRSYNIANKTYNLTLLFIGLDNMKEDSVLLRVNEKTATLKRRDDKPLAGLYIFIHEIYRVREGATITRNGADLSIITKTNKKNTS